MLAMPVFTGSYRKVPGSTEPSRTRCPSMHGIIERLDGSAPGTQAPESRGCRRYRGVATEGIFIGVLPNG